MKINILALDSASQVCGVAIRCEQDGQSQHYLAEHEGSTQHAERMLPLIEQVLEQSQLAKSELHAIAFAQGPGGFTGLRVACGVAQGVAYALGLKVVPVSSLLAIAAQQEPLAAESTQPVVEVVITDARMQELYVGVYQRTTNGWYAFHKPLLINEEQLMQYVTVLQSLQPESVYRVSGDALIAFEGLSERLQAAGFILGDTALAKAHTIAQLGAQAYEKNQLIDPALAAPLYVRNRVAYTIAERESGLGGNPAASWQSVQLRPMTAADVPSVAAIEAALPYEAWTAAQFASSLDAGHWAWVATFNEQVVAYAVLMPAVDECELLLLGVEAAHQRQGIAQQLLCHAEQHARAQGAAKVHLEVRQSNTAAIDLYQGAGYVLVGKRKHYYTTAEGQREDAVLYTKVMA